MSVLSTITQAARDLLTKLEAGYHRNDENSIVVSRSDLAQLRAHVEGLHGTITGEAADLVKNAGADLSKLDTDIVNALDLGKSTTAPAEPGAGAASETGADTTNASNSQTASGTSDAGGDPVGEQGQGQEPAPAGSATGAGVTTAPSTTANGADAGNAVGSTTNTAGVTPSGDTPASQTQP